MEKYVNNNILEKVDDIVTTIKESKEYQDYMFLSNKLAKNDKCNNLIKEIKFMQKEIVKKESLGEDSSEMEVKFANLVTQLNAIPLYNEFISKQQELNYIYQTIKEELDNYFNDLFD